MAANINDDPVGYVLDMAWVDLTRDGVNDALIELRGLVAARMYPEALVLAVAIETDRAKREAVDAMYHSRDTVCWARAHKLAAVLRSMERLRPGDFTIPPPPPPEAKERTDANPIPAGGSRGG